jgi:ATP-dependent helicase Lhr and Lhr-like helicase
VSEVIAEAEQPFGRLHPAVQHHVVNTLGWRGLRTHQEEAIAPILQGNHVLVQAPTAGGKTESAMLPLLSRMLTEEWSGLSVLYLCPIKALLNNLESRLSQLAGMVGRTVGVWHGDVSHGARQRMLRERPDILLATPESVEVMLVSRLVDHRSFFASLRAVVVDEVHAFAGDDRGWHLLALLERLATLAHGDVQRIALSATLANPDDLLRWLTAGGDHQQTVIRGAGGAASTADVQLDYVGSLSNAALVISRLHRGEKRLVFCDSRSQVEELGQALRSHGVQTFVSHSSLGADERRRAEHAFAQGSDCVIVATSTLELGIDVGDLDRVIQIDAPSTVAAFLQRLGRTGRRAGTRRNCLFLATDEDTLLRAAGLLRLWNDGYVEPVRPPGAPYHVLAQQIMAIILQEGGGTDRATLQRRLAGWLVTAGISDEDFAELLDFFLGSGILCEDGPILMLGPEGEERYGARHFLELFSVFNTPPLVTVYHGVAEVGQVHPLSFLRRGDEPPLLALGGRGWRVTHLDWPRKRAWVEPSEYRGKSRWIGGGPPMHFRLAQAVAQVLREGLPEQLLSHRAATAIESMRADHAWVEPQSTTLLVEPPEAGGRWWSFAGDRLNLAVAQWLKAAGVRCTADSLGITVLPSAGKEGGVLQTKELRQAIHDGLTAIAAEGPPAGVDDATRAMKFADAVPDQLLSTMAQERLGVSDATAALAEWPIKVRIASPPTPDSE